MSREIQSSIIQKSVAVINLLAKQKGRLSQTEIAQETGFNKSSTHRNLFDRSFAHQLGKVSLGKDGSEPS